MTEPDLLPCPFCGTAERDDEQERGLPAWLQVTGVSGMFQVECFGCGVEGRLLDTPKEAIEAWNRRHSGGAAALVRVGWPPELVQRMEAPGRVLEGEERRKFFEALHEAVRKAGDEC